METKVWFPILYNIHVWNETYSKASQVNVFFLSYLFKRITILKISVK